MRSRRLTEASTVLEAGGMEGRNEQAETRGGFDGGSCVSILRNKRSDGNPENSPLSHFAGAPLVNAFFLRGG